jgi:hypothetical protein
MYGAVLGASTTTAGALMLPNTGGNRALAVVALTSIVVGVAILLSTAVLLVAKKAYKA